MSDVEFVAMTAAHVDAILPFETLMFGTEAWSRSAYLEELRDTETRWYRAAIRDGQTIGWGGVRVIGGEAEILTVGVLPEQRRAGVGSRLLRELVDEAQRRNARELFLEVRVDNEAAINLYKNEGFDALGIRRGYYDGGRVDALTMRRVLSPATLNGTQS